MAELVLRLRDRELQRVPVIAMRTTLGRDPASGMIIDNAGVSRTHASVIFHEGRYIIRDEESQNGISVNGQLVKEATLNYGDVISIAKFDIELVQSGHFPLARGEAPKAKTVKDVHATMQMDTALAIRLHKEALLAAKGGNRAASPTPPRRPSSVPTAMLVAAGTLALAGASWWLMAH